MTDSKRGAGRMADRPDDPGPTEADVTAAIRDVQAAVRDAHADVLRLRDERDQLAGALRAVSADLEFARSALRAGILPDGRPTVSRPDTAMATLTRAINRIAAALSEPSEAERLRQERMEREPWNLQLKTMDELRAGVNEFTQDDPPPYGQTEEE